MRSGVGVVGQQSVNLGAVFRADLSWVWRAHMGVNGVRILPSIGKYRPPLRKKQQVKAA